MPIKLQLESNDDLWREVQIYKLKNKLKTNNEAVIDLIKKGLKKNNTK